MRKKIAESHSSEEKKIVHKKEESMNERNLNDGDWLETVLIKILRL